MQGFFGSLAPGASSLRALAFALLGCCGVACASSPQPVADPPAPAAEPPANELDFAEDDLDFAPAELAETDLPALSDDEVRPPVPPSTGPAVLDPLIRPLFVFGNEWTLDADGIGIIHTVDLRNPGAEDQRVEVSNRVTCRVDRVAEIETSVFLADLACSPPGSLDLYRLVGTADGLWLVDRDYVPWDISGARRVYDVLPVVFATPARAVENEHSQGYSVYRSFAAPASGAWCSRLEELSMAGEFFVGVCLAEDGAGLVAAEMVVEEGELAAQIRMVAPGHDALHSFQKPLTGPVIHYLF